MIINDVVNYLDVKFHPELQEDYDNSGFLIGSGTELYKGALVALDLTPEVVAEAKQLGLNLIVTHHPLIFQGLKSITHRTTTGRLCLDLVQSHIAVYAAHTNLDNLAWGVNGILARKLGLVDCRILRPMTTDAENGAGMVGHLATSETATGFLLRAKAILGIPFLRTTPFDLNMLVSTVAVCGGSGSFLIDDAVSSGAEIYLTADLKYHDFQRTDGRMILCDVGHYESEQFAKEIIFTTISEKFSNFACQISDEQKSIVHYI